MNLAQETNTLLLKLGVKVGLLFRHLVRVLLLNFHHLFRVMLLNFCHLFRVLLSDFFELVQRVSELTRSM